MRWKAHFLLKANKEKNNPKPVNTCRLKTKNRAPHVSELKPFEDDVARLLKNAKFRDFRDDFIQALEKDKKRIDAPKNAFVFADKIKQEIFTKWKPLHTTSLSPKTLRRHTNTQKTTP